MNETRKRITWSLTDTPIPKKGDRLSTAFNEHYIVIKTEKINKQIIDGSTCEGHYIVTLQPIL